jgi:dihydroorotate dehydrogenase (NAD+) catalytic subunit
LFGNNAQPKTGKKNMANRLEVDIGGLKLDNPVLAASGTFGYGQEYKELTPIHHIGAIVTKSITLHPHQGNCPPRIWETTSGMLNSIGLQNEGIDEFINYQLPVLQASNVKVIASIAGTRKEEYKELAKRLGRTGVDAIEINISCPNIEHSGQARLFAQDEHATAAIIRAVKRQTSKPIITKLSPNVTDITLIAKAAQRAGTDALSLINTVIGMDVDIVHKKPRLGSITGGLSGPAIKPIALRMVWDVYKAVKIPIIGIGGIMDTEDAIAFFLCGATAIQIGTANFVDPQTIAKIISGLREYVKSNRMGNINALTGALRL